MCLSAISGIIIKIFFHDSLVQSLINKDFEKFYNNLLYIAKMNGREKEFKEGIVNDEKYKNCLEKLKKYTEKESVIKYNKKVDGTTNVVHIDQNQINIESDNNHQSNNNLISPKLSTNNENSTGIKKEIKGSLLQIFKYSSVRYILIILSVGWFCNSTLFYGLVIGIKTLKGSQYRNTAILYLCDFCAYNISGFFSNSKLGRRLSLQIFTLGYGIFSLVMFLVYDKYFYSWFYWFYWYTGS